MPGSCGGMSTGEIIKKEKSKGKPQDQAVAIALSEKGKSKKSSLNWRDRMNTLEERTKRGTAKYASEVNLPDDMRTGVDEDVATKEGHDLNYAEIERKEDTLS